jgi:hypothetical protein
LDLTLVKDVVALRFEGRKGESVEVVNQGFEWIDDSPSIRQFVA